MAELIKNYRFNDDKTFLIFNNKYYVIARHLVNTKKYPTGIQVYDNDMFMGNAGRLYFKSNQIQVHQNGQEVAFCKVNDDFFDEIANQLPKITQWTF